MSKRERIRQLEAEVADLKRLLAAVEARPVTVPHVGPVPMPFVPQEPPQRPQPAHPDLTPPYVWWTLDGFRIETTGDIIVGGPQMPGSDIIAYRS